MMYVATEDQLADVFPKPLPGPAFTNLRERIGLCHVGMECASGLRESVEDGQTRSGSAAVKPVL